MNKIILMFVLLFVVIVMGCTSIDDIKGITISDKCGINTTNVNGTITYYPIGECNITLIKKE